MNVDAEQFADFSYVNPEFIVVVWPSPTHDPDLDPWPVSGSQESVAAPREGLARQGMLRLCPGIGKPSSFHYVMQHQFFTFHSRLPSISRTNRGQFFGAYGTRKQDFESKFSKNKFSGDDNPRPPLREVATHPSPTRRAQAPHCWEPDHRARSKVMVPHLWPSKNKLLVPPLIGRLRVELFVAGQGRGSVGQMVHNSIWVTRVTSTHGSR